jgi:spermidine/putrescine transport system substrate-binding protein
MFRNIFGAGVNRRNFLAGSAAIGVSLTGMPRMTLGAEEDMKLNFFNWGTYMNPDTLDNFEETTGISVGMDLYGSNSELFGKLKGGNPGYDVIVPSQDFAERMIKADMLMPLDHEKIPNFENIEARFRDVPFDPGREYSLPYMWGTTGIGYRKSAFDETPDSWKWLYDSDAKSGRIALLKACRTLMSGANRYLGQSVNTTDDADLKAAEELIINQKPHIRTFSPDMGQRLLMQRSVDITMEYSGDLVQIQKDDPDLDYVLPKEGGMIWQDNLAIPKGAPHPENAHRFINFIHAPKPHAAIAEFIGYGTPNKAAKQHVSESYLNNPITFPPDEAIENCQFPLYIGQAGTEKYQAACTRIFAA